jgi:hypothetical protein
VPSRGSTGRRACWVLGALCLVVGTSAHAANSIVFSAADPDVDIGESFTVGVNMDFSDETVGGGVILSWDPAVVSLVGVTMDPGLGDDVDLRCPSDPLASNPVPCPTGSDFVSFGTIAGLTGQHAVADLEFSAVGPGVTNIVANASSPFSDGVGSPLSVSFAAAMIQSSVAAIPVLGTVALALLALLLLLTTGFGLRRQRV